MGIFSWLFRSRDKPKNFYHFSGWPVVFGKSAAGAKVNEFTAMQITAVYACVRILAESIAGLPLHVYEYRGNGKERVPGHPLYFLLHDSPNPEMTSFIFRETAMIHLLLWGNFFAQIIRDGMRRVVGLYPLLPNRMSVDRDENGELVYTYTPMSDSNPNLKSGQSITLRREDVLHIPGLGFDGLVGYSPIAMARNAVGMTLACEEYGSSFFANGARPGGVLKHPGVLKDPSKLRESWQAVYGGTANTGKVVVMEEGVDYQQINATLHRCLVGGFSCVKMSNFIRSFFSCARYNDLMEARILCAKRLWHSVYVYSSLLFFSMDCPICSS